MSRHAAMAVLFSALTGSALAQPSVSGQIDTRDRAATRILRTAPGTEASIRYMNAMDATGGGVMMIAPTLPTHLDFQPETKPAADASQAATAAPGGTAPNSQPPAATPAAPAKLSLLDVAIEGIDAETKGRRPTVRYRYNETDKWTVASVGDKLKEGVIIQLGYFTKIRLRVGEGQQLNFDNAGTFVVTEAYNDGQTDITRIKMNQGKVTFDVKKVNFANDVVITTPEMTLAIKGTSGGIQATPGQPTQAFGAAWNRGLIVLENIRTLQRTEMTRNERSDTVTFQPAMNRAQASIVDTSTYSARERDENKTLKRAEGSTQAVLDVGEINNTGLRFPQLGSIQPVNPRTPVRSP